MDDFAILDITYANELDQIAYQVEREFTQNNFEETEFFLDFGQDTILISQQAQDAYAAARASANEAYQSFIEEAIDASQVEEELLYDFLDYQQYLKDIQAQRDFESRQNQISFFA